MDISLLADREKRILDSLQTMYWDVGNPDDSKYHPIYQQYREIHFEYASQAEVSLEALKRAIFIQWYAFSEPSQLSGIGDLDSASMEKSMKALDLFLRTKPKENEFEWMLAHYIKVEEYPFTVNVVFTSILSLVELTNKLDTSPKYPKAINRDHMANRGCMGRYWNSLSIFS